MSLSDFVPDAKLQTMAAKSADHCVQMMKKRTGLNPDYSDAFVLEIEKWLQVMHLQQQSESKLSDEDLQACAMLFGSYVGETYRKNHGGEWGIADGTPALRFGGGYHSFPFARVYKRLTNGEEDNVYHWYLGMLRYASGSATPTSPASPPATPPPLPTIFPATSELGEFFRPSYGILVPAIVFIPLILSIVLTMALSSDPDYISHNSWPGSVALIVAGLTSWYLDPWLRSRHNRTVVDPKTGERTTWRPSTAYLLIPMRAWGVIFGVIGLILVVGDVIERSSTSSQPTDTPAATPPKALKPR